MSKKKKEKENCECESECTCGCNEGESCECSENVTTNEDELTIKILELEDTILRNKADFINYRKRLEEEQQRILKYANEDLIKEILPIIDNFERAIDMNDVSEEVSKFLAGFKMMYCNMINVLKKYNVIEIDGINKPFDPVYHEAVITEPKEGVESGIVIEVMQKGYILKEKVIRPAMVKVSE